MAKAEMEMTIVLTPKGKHGLYGEFIKSQEKPIILTPGEIWLPGGVASMAEGTEEDKPVNQETCYHTWQDVLLFRFTVTECSKCGKRKDEV